MHRTSLCFPNRIHFHIWKLTIHAKEAEFYDTQQKAFCSRKSLGRTDKVHCTKFKSMRSNISMAFLAIKILKQAQEQVCFFKLRWSIQNITQTQYLSGYCFKIYTRLMPCIHLLSLQLSCFQHMWAPREQKRWNGTDAAGRICIICAEAAHRKMFDQCMSRLRYMQLNKNMAIYWNTYIKQSFKNGNID